MASFLLIKIISIQTLFFQISTSLVVYSDNLKTQEKCHYNHIVI